MTAASDPGPGPTTAIPSVAAASTPDWSWAGWLLPLLVVVWFAAGGSREADPGSPTVRSALMMDTLVTIKAWGPPASATAAIEAGLAEFAAVEAAASFYASASELAHLNRVGWVRPGPLLAPILAGVADLVVRSDGWFDPSFVPVREAYGLTGSAHIASGAGRWPSDAELAELLTTRVGWGRVVASVAGEVRLTASGARIDLGGAAGGLAVDRAAAAMRAAGCPALLIDDGGDIWCEGERAGQPIWRIAVRDPRPGASRPLALVRHPGPFAVSTSGNYERYLTVNGQRVGHIFDPLTGRPASAMISATVVASSSQLADGWSTALFAMPVDRALATAEREGLAALLLTASDTLLLSRPAAAWFDELVDPPAAAVAPAGAPSGRGS